MTAYRNFVQDFPARCAAILDGYEHMARATDREVTLTLAIASAAFVIPFERLRPLSTDHVALDRKRMCTKELDRLLGRPFTSWAIGTWQQHSVLASEIRDQNVEQWLTPGDLQPLKSGRNICSVFVVIRNALAHGNIFTSVSTGRRIDQLLFLSKPRDSESFDLVATSPEAFLAMLRKWVAFIAELKLPADPVQAVYHELPPVFSASGALAPGSP